MIRPTVTTPGSNTSTVRVIISCSAWTISHATGIGSIARCGSLAWPPLPVTVIVSRSADAMIAPPRQLSQPDGSAEVMWMANAPVIGDGVPSASGGTSRRPSSSMNRAPWWPSSPGWNMNSTRPAMSSRCVASSLAAPTSIAVCVSWPQACIVSSTRDEKSSPVSSCIGRASMSPRSRIVGPGSVAGEQGGDAARRLVDRDVERQALQRAEDVLLGDRQVVADLRPLVQRATQLDRRGEQVVRFLAQAGRVERHAVMVGTSRVRAPTIRATSWSTSSTTHDRVVATVTRRRMRAERLRHRAVFIVVTSTAGELLVHRRSDGQGPVAGPVGRRRRRRRRRRRGLRRRGPARAGRGGRRRRGRAARRSAPGGSPTTTSTCVARCYRVVHDGPFRFADGEVVEARWVDAAGLAELRSRASFVPDSVALLPLEVLFPFPPADDPQGR